MAGTISNALVANHRVQSIWIYFLFERALPIMLYSADLELHFALLLIFPGKTMMKSNMLCPTTIQWNVLKANGCRLEPTRVTNSSREIALLWGFDYRMRTKRDCYTNSLPRLISKMEADFLSYPIILSAASLLSGKHDSYHTQKRLNGSPIITLPFFHSNPSHEEGFLYLLCRPAPPP